MNLKSPSTRLLVLLLCVAGGGILVWKLREQPVAIIPENQPLPQKISRARHPAESAKWHDLVDDSLPRDFKLNLANEIQEGLPPQDVDYLFSALKHQPYPGEEEKWWVVLNEIMERMRISGVGADRYLDALGSLIRDRKQPPVVRDYAIQHLAQWIAPAASGEMSPGETDALKKEQALERIAAAIRDPSSARTSIPGTGLMALADASPRIDGHIADKVWTDLRPFLTGLISADAEGDRTSRIAAIQAVGVRKENTYLPAIRSLAANEAADSSVRLAAIASLGLYADPADMAFLSALSQSGGKFQYAARSALTKIVP